MTAMLSQSEQVYADIVAIQRLRSYGQSGDLEPVRLEGLSEGAQALLKTDKGQGAVIVWATAFSRTFALLDEFYRATVQHRSRADDEQQMAASEAARRALESLVHRLNGLA